MLDLGFAYKNGRRDRPLDGKTLAMIFEKPSTRTRVIASRSRCASSAAT